MTPSGDGTFDPIAIVGTGCALPGALDPAALWALVRDERAVYAPVSAAAWGIAVGAPGQADEIASRVSGSVSGFEQVFDAHGLGVPADLLHRLDVGVRWAVYAARQALTQAGLFGQAQPRGGVVLGNLAYPTRALADYALATWLGRAERLCGEPMVRFMSGYPAHVVAAALGFSAGAFALDAACASALYAIELACRRLHDGSADVMLAGGLNASDDLCLHVGFTALAALSPSGQSRPFHRGADGLIPARGAGFVVLERLRDAVAAGHPIQGVIRAVGLSNDGKSSGLLVPSSAGQARAIRSAYAQCGLSPSDISLIECHATGTHTGDRAELASLAEVFAQSSDLPIGSLKSNLGHLITAAGIAGLLKVLGAMHAGVRPASLHTDDPVEIPHPCRLLRTAEPWPDDRPRRAGVSAFGFGGNNAHLIVEQWQPGSPVVAARARSHDPVVVIAQSVLAGSTRTTEGFEKAYLTGEGPTSGGTVAGAFELDAGELGAPPNDLAEALPQQLVFLRTATAIRTTLASLPVARTGLIVGLQCDAEAARYAARWRAASLPADHTGVSRTTAAGVIGCMPNIVANRVSRHFGYEGPCFSVFAEESSGVVALATAAGMLRRHEIDAAVVGAVDLAAGDVHVRAVRGALGAKAAAAGDAAVVMVVKRRADALRDGDTVLAVLEPVWGSAEHVAELAENQASHSVRVCPGTSDLAERFGHAQAASGLLAISAAVSAAARRALPGAGEPRPWLPTAQGHVGVVEVTPLGGTPIATIVRSDPEAVLPPTGWRDTPWPSLAVYTADGPAELRAALERDTQVDGGAMRLSIVARGPDEHGRQRARVLALMTKGALAPGEIAEGVYFGAGRLEGEVAFVFAGPAGGWHGMGRDLLLAMPELGDRLAARMPIVAEVMRWLYDDAHRAEAPTSEQKLWGAAFLSQLHAEVTRGLLGMTPQAVLGYCAGETNALFAMGAWTDLLGFHQAMKQGGVFDRELGGEHRVVKRGWNTETPKWSSWRIQAPIEAVRAALKDETRAHLAIVNAPEDCIVSGDGPACERVVAKVGARRAREIGFDVVMHCPEAHPFAAAWHALHHRPTTPIAGTRFYSHATHATYELTSDSVADAVTRQAMSRIEFPRLVRQAYADGVRVFVEHGPLAGCTRWTQRVLEGRPHLAVSLDQYGRSSIMQVVESVAQLVAAGVPLDHRALIARLAPVPAPAEPPGHPTRRAIPVAVAAHWAPLRSPTSDGEWSVMEPAPQLPSVTRRAVARAASAQRAPGMAHAVAAPAQASHVDELAEAIAILARGHKQLADAHGAYLRHQANAIRRLTEVLGATMPVAGSAFDTTAAVFRRTTSSPPPSPVRHEPPSDSEAASAGPVNTAVARAVAPTPQGPTFDRAQLEVHAGGPISSIFGPLFAQQDGYTRQVRLPQPPLLLADRVTGMTGEPGSMGTGTVWTETDVSRDAWYLYEGHMPAGIMVESGQADLFLISWLGADASNRSDRVYRLLGCDLVCHGGLPEIGDTLRYDIHVDGHAAQGDVRLFFFHYDCRVGDDVRLSVRNGQAGFFTNEELAHSAGVLWTPEDCPPTPDARLDPPVVASARGRFDARALDSFARGELVEAFGPGFERGNAHTRTPTIPTGKMRLLEQVTLFDPAGGPWKRGYLRAVLPLMPASWFFDGHFKNDPCMPGTLMLEGCLQAMAIYLAAVGYTLAHDGWRFEPVPDVEYKLRCRGQAIPTSHEVVYEVFVDEIIDGPMPTLFADVLGSVDGLKAFHCKRMGLRLVPAWPLEPGRIELDVPHSDRPAAELEGVRLDERAMVACAWGPPSAAFGALGEPYDGGRWLQRLPGPPYHFITRIVRVAHAPGGGIEGSEVTAEYDVPPDAWYFRDSGAGIMPFAALLEVALQPCGWLSTCVLVPTGRLENLRIRNLDGRGTVHLEVTPQTGRLVTTARLKSYSQVGGLIIVAFDVRMLAGRGVVYELETVFGFFPEDALANQVGLPTGDAQRAAVDEPGETTFVIADRGARMLRGSARLPDGLLQMLDRVSGLWPRGGRAGLGRIRLERDIRSTDWYFKAHFLQDPVQPGSLGVDAMFQGLQAFMLTQGMDEGIARPRFQAVATDVEHVWKYRGQVVASNTLVVVDLEMTAVQLGPGEPTVTAEGSLWVDGKRIYEARGLGMRIVSGPASATLVEASTESVTDGLQERS